MARNRRGLNSFGVFGAECAAGQCCGGLSQFHDYVCLGDSVCELLLVVMSVDVDVIRPSLASPKLYEHKHNATQIK